MVGKNESPVPNRRNVSMDELDVLEKRANDTVDEINKVQEIIKVLKEVGDVCKRLCWLRSSNNRITCLHFSRNLN